MLVSRYAGATCALQVGALWALGAIGAGLAVQFGLPHLAWAGLVPFGLGLFVLSFYRDPERTPPADADAWISPADGVVTDIAVVDEPHFLKGKALRVGIFLSPLNVHVNRSPVAGTVEAVVHREGLCLAATGTACIDQNESTLLGLRLEDGLRIGVRQVTGALARTIVCGATVGQKLARGERYGMIKLGSRTELLVPEGAGFAPAVAIGDVVRGGETVLGRLGARAGKAPAEAHGEAKA
jgi:phosphatidylserine decarboxylase